MNFFLVAGRREILGARVPVPLRAHHRGCWVVRHRGASQNPCRHPAAPATTYPAPVPPRYTAVPAIRSSQNTISKLSKTFQQQS